MIDEKILKSVLDLQNALGSPSYSEALKTASRITTPLSDRLRALEGNSGIGQMLESIKHHETALHAAVGPLEELRKAGLFEVLRWRLVELEPIQRAMDAFDARFRLPDMAEAARLIAGVRLSPLWGSLAEQMFDVQRAMESMRAPWLDAHATMRSVAGFAQLQGIGIAIATMPSFGDNLASALRISLGDWRYPITFPPEILTDFAARADFYASLGFDRALTDFPAPAFQQSLDIGDLRREPPTLVDLYGDPIPGSHDADEEEALARTNMAHSWLLRLETQLRRFIDERMTQAFGADWPKHRLPNGLYEQWDEKKRKAEKVGRKERPLIAYADFKDYERLVCKSDNWREIFAAFFGRPESVRESFQRLHLIRLDTMHARPITQDDELLLYVETRRLVRMLMGT